MSRCGLAATTGKLKGYALKQQEKASEALKTYVKFNKHHAKKSSAATVFTL